MASASAWLGGLVDEEHAGPEQVIDSVAENLDGEALLGAAAATNDG
jgi:hypothetical protein